MNGNAADPAKAREAAVTMLTAPGGRFEVVEEDVLGRRMRVFRNRLRSLRELLLTARRHGDTEYLVCEENRWTFAEHHARVASLAQALRERYHIGKGDRVAILSANNAEWIMTFWAATSLGAITVGMNSLWSAREVEYGLADSAPSLIVTDGRRRELLGDTGTTVLSMETDIPALASQTPGAELPDSDIAEDDPAVILYTSGTTGRPKGAVHSHRNVLAACDYHLFNDALAEALGRPPTRRRYLLATPLFHIAALHNLAVPRLATAETAVIYTGRFEAERVLRLIERERVTNWGAVPTMANRLLEHGDLSGYDLSSLTALSLNSAPSSPALMDRVRELLPHAAPSLGTTYGLTETSTAATLATSADLARCPDSVGTPVVNVDVEIRDAEGNRVPDGVEGEICVRGAQVMLGYWNNQEATAAAIDPDGWLRTGDLGMLADGHLRISSRRADLILRGGENVYPVEIENVLAEHPRVAESVVLGLPHNDLGEEVAAVVVPAGPDAVRQDELSAFVAQRLARYKVPTRWLLTTRPLPRNATGKVERHRVRDSVERRAADAG
ncbi:acyl-CoA synthetase (AMP-forming)/AMP-acid ligase II [Saccharomonospora marina XMU15]|uniref:Acyl-CoA synthetase (AMP-forming)/AMP-acid ligase II n=1 Tax=Saccharomonospora marina XMU15 TaxID=882083 RepID=H5X8J7_9PSEU|nr:AMP-binding protein [Saccharomonospora marina]EHR50293.1 acyl-CoA synthetase (AMP-forming)/AMP-acid ligase II [Saccharomonospora marina XMU15]